MNISLDERVVAAKKNIDEINRLIEEYKPFIASCANSVSGRYLNYGEDDELSVAMLAFAESIKSYDIEKGGFLAFARGVIKRRLIDHYRKEKRHIEGVSLDEQDDTILASESEEVFLAEEERGDRLDEIEVFKKELAQWDISFSELASISPKHKGTRKICGEIIRFIILRPELIDTIIKKKYLPLAEIEKDLKISRKKVERFRKYILAVVIILHGDYYFLREYVRDFTGGD